MGFCVHCGTPRQAGGRFCASCGTAFDQAAAPPAPPVPAWAPAVRPDPGYPPVPAASAPHASMRLLGRWVTGLLGFMAFLAVVMAVGAAWQLSALGQYFDTPAGSFAEAQAIDDLIAAEDFHTGVSGVTVLAAIAVGVVFVVWLFRAAANVRRAGATGTLHEGWAIGGWFVPFGLLFLPVMVVSQAWRAADVSLSRPIGTAWKRVRQSPLVIAWWVTFVAGIVANRAAGEVMDPDGTRTVIETAYGLWLVAALLLLAAAVLGAVMVHRLSDRQDRAHAAVLHPSDQPASGGRKQHEVLHRMR